MERRVHHHRVSSPRRRGVDMASAAPVLEEKKKEKESTRANKKEKDLLWRTAKAYAAAAEKYIIPVREDPVAATTPAVTGTTAAAPAASVGCTSLLLQTPQALDDAVDALALQHHLSPDDSGFVRPPLKFSYEGAGLVLLQSASKTAAAAPTAAGRTAGAAATAAAERREFGGAYFENSCCSQGQLNTPAYDWLYALGCLNCGKPLTLAGDLLPSAEAATSSYQSRPIDSSSSSSSSEMRGGGDATCDDVEMRRPALICSSCGHRVCPLHEANEAETLADAKRLPDWSSCFDSSSSSNCGECVSSKKDDKKTSSESDSWREFGRRDGVYLFGLRQQYVTGEWSKRFWQERFMGSNFEQQQLQQRLRLVEAVGKEKHGVVCKEICEQCGNNEAFYSSFQARSADEGMTVMYECTRCGYRRILNT